MYVIAINTIMNSYSFINTNPIYSRGDFLPAVEHDSFGWALLPAVLTLLFCIYDLFIQYTCSTYFLFFLLATAVMLTHCEIFVSVTWDPLLTMIPFWGDSNKILLVISSKVDSHWLSHDFSLVPNKTKWYLYSIDQLWTFL